MAKLLPQDFEMFSGDSKDLVITVVDENDVTFSLTSASIKFNASREPGSTVLINKGTDVSPGGITITNPAGGIFTVTLDPGDTKDLTEKFLYYEAEITDVLGNIATVTFGTITLKPDLVE